MSTKEKWTLWMAYAAVLAGLVFLIVGIEGWRGDLP